MVFRNKIPIRFFRHCCLSKKPESSSENFEMSQTWMRQFFAALRLFWPLWRRFKFPAEWVWLRCHVCYDIPALYFSIPLFRYYDLLTCQFNSSFGSLITDTLCQGSLGTIGPADMSPIRGEVTRVLGYTSKAYNQNIVGIESMLWCYCCQTAQLKLASIILSVQFSSTSANRCYFYDRATPPFLFIEPMLHLLHVKQMYNQPIHLTH